MNVLLLLPYALDRAPSQRLRVERWLPYLHQHGWATETLVFPTPLLTNVMYRQRHYGAKIIGTLHSLISYRQRFRRLDLASFDVALVHREAVLVGPALIERELVRQRLPFVFEFDDPIFLPSQSRNSPWLTVGRWYSKISELCRTSAHVVVANSYLERYARMLNQHVSIIPMGMEPGVIPPKQHSQHSPLLIGWTGSFSTAPFIATIQPVLATIQHEFNCRIQLIGAPQDYRLDGVDLEIKPWTPASEKTLIRQFDIGINPLPITDWTKGKGTGKTLQYMNAGVPCIATPTGANTDIIVDEQNGLLAHTLADWEAALRRLLTDVSERRRLGAAGLATVEQRFNIRTHAQQLSQILSEVAQEHPRCVESVA